MFLTELLSTLEPAVVQRIAKLPTATNIQAIGGQRYTLHTMRDGERVHATVRVTLGLNCKLHGKVEYLS